MEEIVVSQLNQHPIKRDEKKRIRILKESHILDQDSQDDNNNYDSYTTLLGRVFKVPIVLITIIDLNHVLLKSKLNWEWGDEVPRHSSFSSHVIKEDASSIVMAADCSLDSRFKDLPNVTGSANFRFFAGTPIICEGRKLGAVCVFDTVPHHDIEQKKLDVLLEVGKMVSDYITEKRLRHIHVNGEQIQYLVGITHHLKIPKDKIKMRFFETQRAYKRWKSLQSTLKKIISSKRDSIEQNQTIKDLTEELIKAHTKLSNSIQLLNQNVISMSHHLDMSLKLAYVSFETKRKRSMIDVQPSQIVLNPFLHPERAREKLMYKTFEQLVDYFNNQLYPERYLFNDTSTGCQDLISWNIQHHDLETEDLSSTKIAVDIDLVSLVLHSILKPIFQQQELYQGRRSIKRYIHSFDIKLETRPLSDREMTNLINSNDSKPGAITPALLQENAVKYLIITISPNNLEVYYEFNDHEDEDEEEDEISSPTSPTSHNVSYFPQEEDISQIKPESQSPGSSSPKNAQSKKLLIRQNTLQDLNSGNIVEYSGQNLLRDLLQSSNGGLEIYHVASDPSKQYQESEENSLNSFEHPVYKVYCLCTVKTFSEQNDEKNINVQQSNNVLSSENIHKEIDNIDATVKTSPSNSFKRPEGLETQKKTDQMIQRDSNSLKRINLTPKPKPKPSPSSMNPSSLDHHHSWLDSLRNLSSMIISRIAHPKHNSRVHSEANSLLSSATFHYQTSSKESSKVYETNDSDAMNNLPINATNLNKPSASRPIAQSLRFFH